MITLQNHIIQNLDKVKVIGEGVKKSMEFSILRIGWFEKVIFHKKMVKNCLKLPKCSFNKSNLFFND